MSNIFITSYFELDKSKTDFYFENFQKLIDTNFEILLYLDSKLESRVENLKQYSNLKIILLDWNDLYLIKTLSKDQIDSLEIPSKNPKDNVNYLLLMNSKSYIMKLALEQCSHDTLIWLDFAGLKLTNDIEHFKNNFSKLKKYEKIIIPGGFRNRELLTDDNLFRNICWRFLGTIAVFPRNLIEKFNDEQNIELKKLLDTGKITWEVNIWANIEYNNPDLIQYFRADHNKTMFGLYDKKIILISMIKNEEKIIRRCIDSVRSICDAFCVSDTMSTDNTVTIVRDYINELNKNNVPGKLYQNPWSNFGHNRTISYNNTVEFCKELGWDQDNTYGLLLDADMKLIVQSKFNKNNFTHNGYKIIQDNGHIEYDNTRFIKLNGSWKSVGVTHEYWDGPDLGGIRKDEIYISDIGDGGCKDNKFQRDLQLLTKGIEDEPNNGRYHFYLAQTHKDTGNHKEAIRLYKRRIVIGGWDEEVWYSHYMIARCWVTLGNIHKAEMWANKAYEFRKSRAEPLHMLVNLFRDRGMCIKAYHYYKMAKNIPESFDSLFVEKSVYKYLLDYENTIIHYWVFPNDRLEGLKSCIMYLNKNTHQEDNVYNNIDHYIQKLSNDDKVINFGFPVVDNYCSSSSAIIQVGNKTLMNVRYVNYRIQQNGSYMMYDGDSFNNANNVRTKNSIVYLDKEMNPVCNPIFFDNEVAGVIKQQHSGIKGLEDIRLFNFKDKVYYIATSREFSYNETNRMVMGEYDINNLKYSGNKILLPPTETNCEKNWIPINHNNEKILFIYDWHPLQIGEVDSFINKLNITVKYDTPKFFRHYRGSSTFAEYDNKLWCITHGVKYYTPRKYYHQFVVLEKNTYKPIKYSVPFYFNQYAIEYCVGLMIKDGVANIVFSQNDKDTSLLRIEMNKVNKYMINI